VAISWFINFMPALNVLSLLQKHFSDPALTKSEVIQSLWSGYGEIVRFVSPKLQQSFIVKHINPVIPDKHPRGWNTPTSHSRKLQSYQIEAHFYQQFAPLCDEHCFLPKLLASFTNEQEQVLVLTDLDSLGFAQRKSQANLKDVELGVKWLSYFHARFMQQPLKGLWPIGTYWHLATRQDEYAVMADSALKQSAYKIDELLNQSKFQTCLHGDAKLANLCFADEMDTNHLAAVDFQYVGRGVGVKDLAYFLGSCLSDKDLKSYSASIINGYFEHLKSALIHYRLQLDVDDLEQEWRDLYCFAWADFQRFLLGWSPQHSKINSYMQEQTSQALEKLAP
jgi:thiamine kinase-like enzyme